MTPSYALEYNASGQVTGVHQWADSSVMELAANEIECTFEQFQNSGMYQVTNGEIVPLLGAYQTAQSALISTTNV